MLYLAWSTRNDKWLKKTTDALGYLLYPAKVKVLAEWDTVSAMGLPFGMWRHELSFVNDVVPSAVENAFLAFALNERRPSFKPMIWRDILNNTTKVKQCAFLGCHSDVGGGNPDPGLATVSLVWMISQIRQVCGASFDKGALLEFFTPLQVSPLRNITDIGRGIWPWALEKPYVQNSSSTEGTLNPA
jgi:uncharacterized protein (DUF2235 family)